MFNVLDTPLIRVVGLNDAEVTLDLPGTLAALVRDEVATFPGLRAHQRHAWHAFLCQVGALAMIRTGMTVPDAEEEIWRKALRSLTPTHSDGSPWCLVAPANRPALLQPPIISGLAVLRNASLTPDALDVLVASRNHDLKSAVMTRAKPDDWLFALVTLQTMAGFFGVGNYGISRMNGGYANRPALGITQGSKPGGHFARDVARLIALRRANSEMAHHPAHDDLALLWLEPWSGTKSLPLASLDPLYIEICRRVRLVIREGRIRAVMGGSKVPRVTPVSGGLTGDPWAPLVKAEGGGLKVFTPDASGFHYRRMVRLMWPDHEGASPLQAPTTTDPEGDLILVARALVRGRGKTEGFYERRVPLSSSVRRLAPGPMAERAKERVRLSSQIGRVLWTALLTLFQGGPEWVNDRDECSARKAQVFLDRLDAAVDTAFFPALWREVDAFEAGEDAARAERARWVRELLRVAAGLLDQADMAASKATRRRLRARVVAEEMLHGMIRRNQDLAPYAEENAGAA